MTEANAATGPLEGLRVIEIGTLVAAPFATRILAEFGADVIKIEPPGGDPLRKWRRLHKGTSLWWYLQARNKRLIKLDLKSEGGRDVARRLLAKADILVENLRPGGLERLGLGWDELSAANPDLVMVRISGYGQTGPYRDRPGFGAVGEAMGGIRYTTGDPAAAPSRVGVSLGDSLASLHAVIGALMALLQVKTGKGRGQIVDVSLFESVFNIMEGLVPEYDVFGDIRERTGGRLPGIVPSNTYRTRDGAWVVIAGNGDAIFRRLMSLIGRQDLRDDPTLQSNDGRATRDDEIDGAIADWVGQRDQDAVLQELREAEVPSGAILTVKDIVEDPQYLARDMILPGSTPDGTSFRVPGITPKLSRTPGKLRWLGQHIGADTDAILTEAGYSPAAIESLRREGAV